MRRPGVIGVATALLGAFPVAALVALCYRFPVPFSGYMSGPAAVRASLVAVLFYGLLGGFLVLTVLGVVAATTATRLAHPDARRVRWLTIAFALAGDFVAVMVLAVLDKIVGAW